jgi:hypothetical protein
MRIAPFAALATLLALAPSPAAAYPLDGFPQTGMLRLEAYRLAAAGSGRPSFLTEGEMLPSDAIRLGLVDHPNFAIPAPDPELSARLRELLGGDAASYGLTVLDWSDPARPRYAAVNGDRIQNPGSVGKVMVLLGWFQALADVYPDDLAARRRVMYEGVIQADRFIRNDEHEVPVWTWGMSNVDRRPIAEGDRANVYTFLDWMASASSNAAGSMNMKHLVLLKHFGVRYPVPETEGNAFVDGTSKSTLSKIFLDAMQGAAKRNGIDWNELRQGALFTREGKTLIPGTNSVSTAGELMQYIVQMEKGALVDPFSSLEIKKLLYLTDKRIRYAASPILDPHAVYFKSGSLYSCRPEPGFDCGKFRGNRLNFMNSMVVVETTDRNPPLRYATVVLSNVLKRDSSELHQELASKIHQMIESFHPAQ